MKQFFLSLLSVFVLSIASAQKKDNWDGYLAQYDNGPGLISFNTSLKDKPAWSSLPNAVITGITFKGPLKDGFPDSTEMDVAQEIGDKVFILLKKSGAVKEAGYFTNNGERLGYYYVNDTTQLRNTLSSFYEKNYSDYKYYVNIRPDKEGEIYLTFLYPNGITREYMTNRSILDTAIKNGDNIEKPRQTDHWLYFKTLADRDLFITYARQQQFKIEAQTEDKKQQLPFGLQLSRIDKIDLASISAITLELRRQARSYNGVYDGWETFLVK